MSSRQALKMMEWTNSGNPSWSTGLHLVCFISNAYKQWFWQELEILKILSNRSPWNWLMKQQWWNSQAKRKFLNQSWRYQRSKCINCVFKCLKNCCFLGKDGKNCQFLQNINFQVLDSPWKNRQRLSNDS